MIPLLLRYWKPLAAVVFVAAVWLHGQHTGSSRVRAAWQAEVAEASAAAAEEKALIDARNALKDARNAAYAISLEVKYAKELEAALSGRSAFTAELARRMRNAEARCAGGVVSAAAADPGLPEGGAGDADGGHRGPDPESADRLREIGLTLQSQLRQCRAWVLQHGR